MKEIKDELLRILNVNYLNGHHCNVKKGEASISMHVIIKGYISSHLIMVHDWSQGLFYTNHSLEKKHFWTPFFNVKEYSRKLNSFKLA